MTIMLSSPSNGNPESPGYHQQWPSRRCHQPIILDASVEFPFLSGVRCSHANLYLYSCVQHAHKSRAVFACL